MQRVPYQKLTAIEGGETSAVIRARIEAARERQQARFEKLGNPGLLANGDDGWPASRLGRGADLLQAGRGLNQFRLQQPHARGREANGSERKGVSSCVETEPNVSSVAFGRETAVPTAEYGIVTMGFGLLFTGVAKKWIPH
jgi:hypothetical protein